jgi:tetratricopeptide (TPR) repeat protein
MFLIVVVLVSVHSSYLSAFQTASSYTSPSADEKKLKIAAMQYDLIFLLIEKKSFSQVEPEWKKVIDQKLSARYEAAIADSLLDIVNKLYEAKQFTLSLKILDESLLAVPFSNRSKSNLLRFKSLLYKDSGDVDEAIKTMQQAIELADK